LNFFKKVFFLFLCGVIWLASAPWAAEGSEARKHALLIGINDYKGGGFGRLEGTHNDVSLVRDLLTQKRFGFAPENITVLLDAQATHSGILGAIGALAEKAGPDDIVYIHYSGHGSTATDENGDEEGERGVDSTLVTYGSRSRAPVSGDSGSEGRGGQEGLNDYDILDDELEIALFELTAKTQNVVFVADACHSGTVTRGGDAIATRGVPADARPNPASGVKPLDANALRSWVAAGAAGVNEKAFEYLGDDKKTKYGAFTWFWVKALESSTGDDTWQMIHDRARALMRGAGLTQNPFLEGENRRQIFGGLVDKIPKKFTVTSVSPSVRIDVGTFAGVSENSEFQVEKYGALTDARLTVKKADPYTCEADVLSGSVELGDTVILTKWQPSFTSLKVAIGADYPSDEPLVGKLRDLIAGSDRLAVYELTDSTAESDMLLQVTRPITDADGKIVMEENSGLPKKKTATPETAPEVWVMAPSQANFYNGRENLKAALDEKGLELLEENLEKLARLHGMYNMRFSKGDDEGLDIQYRLFVPTTEEEWNALSDDARIELGQAPEGKPLKWKQSRVVSANDDGIDRLPEEGLLQVRVDNQSDRPYHIYGVNATRDAQITVFLPSIQETLTQVLPGKKRDFKEILFLNDADEYVRVVATLNPINNIHILDQEAVRVRTNKGDLSLVENLLLEQVYRSTRGDPGYAGIAPADLSSTGTSFVIATGAQ
jgi:hypothetical protein